MCQFEAKHIPLLELMFSILKILLQPHLGGISGSNAVQQKSLTCHLPSPKVNIWWKVTHNKIIPKFGFQSGVPHLAAPWSHLGNHYEVPIFRLHPVPPMSESPTVETIVFFLSFQMFPMCSQTWDPVFYFAMWTVVLGWVLSVRPGSS